MLPISAYRYTTHHFFQASCGLCDLWGQDWEALLASNYLICGTPRTGSTLLCQYLTSAEVAGRPHSYFRKQDMVSWAENWRILDSNGSYRFADYIIGTCAAASTENGVIAIRVMWGSLEELLTELGQLYPQLAGRDLALLEKAFGQLKFVYLCRNDVTAQAISLYRAEKSDYWHSIEGRPPQQQPVFDFDEIKSRVEMLEQHNVAWQNWFQKAGVNPLAINYEELSADPVCCTQKVLEFLELTLPEHKRLEAPNRRLADETTAAWIEEFRRQLRNRTT